MHFADLSPCTYSGGPDHAENWRVPLLSIGWIDDDRPYLKGSVDSLVKIKLKELLRNMQEEFPYLAHLGTHECTLCQAKHRSGSGIQFSNIVLFVPGADCVYATPGMVGHYIDEHGYAPPQAFCQSVMRCPRCTSLAYREELCTTNGGPIPFPVPMIGRDGRVMGWKFEA